MTGPTGPTVSANNLFGYLSTDISNVPSGTRVPFDQVTTNGTAITNLGAGIYGLQPNQTYEVSYHVRENIDAASNGEGGAVLTLNGAVYPGGGSRVEGVTPPLPLPQIVELTKTVLVSTTMFSTLSVDTLNISGGTNDLRTNSSISIVKLA